MSDRALWRLECENERLRDEVARLRLNDEEREAIAYLAEICDSQAASAHEGQAIDTANRWLRKAEILRGLLNRLENKE